MVCMTLTLPLEKQRGLLLPGLCYIHFPAFIESLLIKFYIPLVVAFVFWISQETTQKKCRKKRQVEKKKNMQIQKALLRVKTARPAPLLLQWILVMQKRLQQKLHKCHPTCSYSISLHSISLHSCTDSCSCGGSSFSEGTMAINMMLGWTIRNQDLRKRW